MFSDNEGQSIADGNYISNLNEIGWWFNEGSLRFGRLIGDDAANDVPASDSHFPSFALKDFDKDVVAVLSWQNVSDLKDCISTDLHLGTVSFGGACCSALVDINK